MANTIKIKRGLSTDLNNASLQQGELAMTTDTYNLYVGVGSGNYIKIGGGPKNISDGKAKYSVRTINSASESNAYKLGECAFAEGKYTKASGEGSHAEGDSTTASEWGSHAEGYNTTASGQFSHTEGQGTLANGNYSHAEGYKTTAQINGSHAEGYNTVARGTNSHAEGYFSETFGYASHAEGRGTKASDDSQHVQGKYNISDTTSAHIVGNGVFQNNSNAHTLDWSGNAWFAGDIYTGSTSGKNKDEGSKKLATEEYVNSKSSITTVKSSETDTNIITLIKNTVQSTGEPKSNLIYLDTTANKTYTLSTCSFKDSTYSLIFTDDSKYISITFTSDATTITKEEGNLTALADDILNLSDQALNMSISNLNNNSDYRFFGPTNSGVTTLGFTFEGLSLETADDFKFQVTFQTASSGCTFSLTETDSIKIKLTGDDVTDGVLNPVANKVYEIAFYWNGLFMSGIVRGVEHQAVDTRNKITIINTAKADLGMDLYVFSDEGCTNIIGTIAGWGESQEFAVDGNLIYAGYKKTDASGISASSISGCTPTLISNSTYHAYKIEITTSPASIDLRQK